MLPSSPTDLFRDRSSVSSARLNSRLIASEYTASIVSSSSDFSRSVGESSSFSTSRRVTSSTRARASGGRPASFGSSRCSSARRIASNRCRSATTVGMTSRERSQSREPRGLLLDDGLRARQLGAALGQVVLHDLLQVVDVVEEDLLEVAGRGLDVARHRDVDDEQRTVRPLAHDRLHEFARDDRGRGAGRGHRDVRRGERVRKLRPRHRFTLELGSEPLRRRRPSGWR